MTDAPAGFVSPLHVRLLPEWDGHRPRWVLTHSLLYYSAILGRVLIVPRGFVCDGESLPFTATFTGPLCFHAGVLHDWAYAAHQTTKAEADAIYHEALLSVGLDPFYARQRHHMVATYGQGAWDSGPMRLRTIDLRTLADVQRPYGVMSDMERDTSAHNPVERVEA